MVAHRTRYDRAVVAVLAKVRLGEGRRREDEVAEKDDGHAKIRVRLAARAADWHAVGEEAGDEHEHEGRGHDRAARVDHIRRRVEVALEDGERQRKRRAALHPREAQDRDGADRAKGEDRHLARGVERSGGIGVGDERRRLDGDERR